MLKDSLFAKYLKDRQGIEVLESEFGFITYKLNGEECFIVDMCVDKSTRMQGHGRFLLNELESIAKNAGAKILKPAQSTFYGGYAGYFQDLDGHIWEVAYSPCWD